MISQSSAMQGGSQLTVELVTNSMSWTPRPGVTTYYVEPCGGGQAGFTGTNGTNPADPGGASGALGFAVLRGVVGPLTISIGAGGAAPGGAGGDTTVSYNGLNYIAPGGGKLSGRYAPGGAYNNATTGANPSIKSVPSLLLKAAPVETPGASASTTQAASIGGSGGPSPLAPGGVCLSSSLSGGNGGPGAGGASGGWQSNAPRSGGSGGNGFVLIGYFEVGP